MQIESVSSEKKALRKAVRELRARMTPSEQTVLSREIFKQVRASGQYQAARTVFAYMSLPGEVQTKEFIEAVWRDGKKAAVPRTDMENHQIHFFYIDDFSQVRKGTMGILEPESGCLCADGDENALVIMPGVAFDRSRHRIGYGGGFYDRYLEAHPAHPTMAVAYPFQVFDSVPQEGHDLRPDILVVPDPTDGYRIQGGAGSSADVQ